MPICVSKLWKTSPVSYVDTSGLPVLLCNPPLEGQVQQKGIICIMINVHCAMQIQEGLNYC